MHSTCSLPWSQLRPRLIIIDDDRYFWGRILMRWERQVLASLSKNSLGHLSNHIRWSIQRIVIVKCVCWWHFLTVNSWIDCRMMPSFKCSFVVDTWDLWPSCIFRDIITITLLKEAYRCLKWWSTRNISLLSVNLSRRQSSMSCVTTS
jgi:hypothetical protein